MNHIIFSTTTVWLYARFKYGRVFILELQETPLIKIAYIFGDLHHIMLHRHCMAVDARFKYGRLFFLKLVIKKSLRILFT